MLMMRLEGEKARLQKMIAQGEGLPSGSMNSRGAQSSLQARINQLEAYTAQLVARRAAACCVEATATLCQCRTEMHWHRLEEQIEDCWNAKLNGN